MIHPHLSGIKDKYLNSFKPGQYCCRYKICRHWDVYQNYRNNKEVRFVCINMKILTWSMETLSCRSHLDWSWSFRYSAYWQSYWPYSRKKYLFLWENIGKVVVLFEVWAVLTWGFWGSCYSDIYPNHNIVWLCFVHKYSFLNKSKIVIEPNILHILTNIGLGCYL